MGKMRTKAGWVCFMITVCLVFLSGGMEAMAGGLIAHWAMEKMENGAIKDVTGNGHDAVFYTKVKGSKPEFEPGRMGQAMRFEADKLMWLSAAKSADFNIKNNITLMAWVQPSKKMSRHSGEILCKGFDINERGQDPWHGWRLRCGWSMFFFKYTMKDGQAAQWKSPGGSVPIGSWTHVAVTFDGKTVKYYANAVEKLSKPVTGDLTTNKVPFVIGNYVGSKSAYAFDGLLDEVKIFTKVLTSDEIWDESCPE